MSKNSTHFLRFAVLSLLIVNGSIFYILHFFKPHGLIVAILDIGQGDAIYIESPTGNQMLIDGGPDTTVLSKISSLMPFFDHSLDVVLATHPDQDHIGGLPSVFNHYTVGMYLKTDIKSTSGAYNEISTLADTQKSIEPKVLRGSIIDLGGGAYIQILFPNHSMATERTANKSSIIFRLTYGKTAFLFAGDAPKELERFVAFTDPKSVQSDVLKVSHHGSKYSSDEQFLKIVNPTIAAISVGANNTYGHPSVEVTNRLQTLHIKTLETEKIGTIIFDSDGEKVSIR